MKDMDSLLAQVLAFRPNRLVPPFDLQGHIPFVAWLVKELQPATFVQLGTQSGNLYFAACQTVAENSLPTRCWAVGTWQAEELAQRHSVQQEPGASDYNRQHFGAFYLRFFKGTDNHVIRHHIHQSAKLGHFRTVCYLLLQNCQSFFAGKPVNFIKGPEVTSHDIGNLPPFFQIQKRFCFVLNLSKITKNVMKFFFIIKQLKNIRLPLRRRNRFLQYPLPTQNKADDVRLSRFFTKCGPLFYNFPDQFLRILERTDIHFHIHPTDCISNNKLQSYRSISTYIYEITTFFAGF